MRIVVAVVVWGMVGASFLSAAASGVRAEVNLGPFPFDYYLQTGSASSVLPNCPSGSTVRSCMQSSFSSYATQGVTGIRFFFALCGASSTPLGTGTAPPLTTACGSSFNPTISQVNSTWLAAVNAFMADVVSYGQGKLTLTPTPSFVASANGRNISVADTCTTGNPMTSFFFEPTLPYPEVTYGTPQGNGINNYYNCAAQNPIFVGWNNIYMAINAFLQSAHNNGVTIDELDVQNELNFNDFTVMARLIYDAGACVAPYCTTPDYATGSPDGFNQLRVRMSNNSFDPLRVFPSATEDRTTAALYDCGSVYGDSARIFHLSGAVAAISGGDIGNPTGYSKTNALPCGGTVGSGSTKMFALAASWAAPDLVDIHSYPCLTATAGGPCITTQSGATIQGEATTVFSDIDAFLNSWGPSGWRGYNASLYYALATIGETHTTALNGSLDCDGDPTYSAQYGYAGYAASSLNNHRLSNGAAGTVLRPWDVYAASGCWKIPLTVNPPYVPVP